MNVAFQTENPMNQARMIQESRTIGTVGEWAQHDDRVLSEPTVVIIDDWEGGFFLEMFPRKAMDSDGRATSVTITLELWKVPVQDTKAEHAPSRTIERQLKTISFSLSSFGVALEADLNLLDEGESAFLEDIAKQTLIVQLSFIKQRKVVAMIALREGAFLDRHFHGLMKKALIDVQTTVRQTVAEFGVLNNQDTLVGLMQLKATVGDFESKVADGQTMERMIMDRDVPNALAYNPSLRNNWINAATVGTAITEATLANPMTPLDIAFPNMRKHFWLRDKQIAAEGGHPDRRRHNSSKIFMLDDGDYGHGNAPPSDRDDYERMITTLIPNGAAGRMQEFTLRDAVKGDHHFAEEGKGVINPLLKDMLKGLNDVVRDQGVGHQKYVDPMVFRPDPLMSVEKLYENTEEHFRVIDFWGDCEEEFLAWDHLLRNGRAWRHFVNNNSECTKNITTLLCEVFVLMDTLSNPNMDDNATLAFLARPVLGTYNETDRMLRGTSMYRVPDLPQIDEEGYMRQSVTEGEPAVTTLRYLKADSWNLHIADWIPAEGERLRAPRYPYGFGCLPGLFYLSDLLAKGDENMGRWVAQSKDLEVLKDFRRLMFAVHELAERCYPECIFHDGEMYTPEVHKTDDGKTNQVIALLSNTMFAVKYPYFILREGVGVGTDFATDLAFTPDQVASILNSLIRGVPDGDVNQGAARTLLTEMLESAAAVTMLPPDLRDQMKNAPLLEKWHGQWKEKGYDQSYIAQHDDLKKRSGDRERGNFYQVLLREVLSPVPATAQASADALAEHYAVRLYVLRMLLDAVSSDFRLDTLSDDYFKQLRKDAADVFARKNRQPPDSVGTVTATSQYANARHTISRQSFLQLQRMLRRPGLTANQKFHYRMFLPANPNDATQALDMGTDPNRLDFLDFAQTFATTSMHESPLQATAFAHPSLFARAPFNVPTQMDIWQSDDKHPFFKWVDRDKDSPVTQEHRGRAIREWQAIFRGYAGGTNLMYFDRFNLIHRIKYAHEKTRDPWERMGAMMAAMSRPNRRSLDAMIDCQQPIPLNNYALLLPYVQFKTSHLMFTTLEVGRTYIRDYLSDLSSGQRKRTQVDTLHEVVVVNYNQQLGAFVTKQNAVFIVPDAYVSQYVKGWDLKIGWNAHFVNMGGEFTRDRVFAEHKGMLSLAGIFHVEQFHRSPSMKIFKREPWPSSIYFNFEAHWAEVIGKRKKPETIQSLEALARDTVPTGLVFVGNTEAWNRKTQSFQKHKGVGFLDNYPVEDLERYIRM